MKEFFIKEDVKGHHLFLNATGEYILTTDTGERMAKIVIALEKQISKKATRDSMYSPALCPTCHTDKICKDLEDGYYRYFTDIKYCPECGQLLKW